MITRELGVWDVTSLLAVSDVLNAWDIKQLDQPGLSWSKEDVIEAIDERVLEVGEVWMSIVHLKGERIVLAQITLLKELLERLSSIMSRLLTEIGHSLEWIWVYLVIGIVSRLEEIPLLIGSCVVKTVLDSLNELGSPLILVLRVDVKRDVWV